MHVGSELGYREGQKLSPSSALLLEEDDLMDPIDKFLWYSAVACFVGLGIALWILLGMEIASC